MQSRSTVTNQSAKADADHTFQTRTKAHTQNRDAYAMCITPMVLRWKELGKVTVTSQWLEEQRDLASGILLRRLKVTSSAPEGFSVARDPPIKPPKELLGPTILLSELLVPTTLLSLNTLLPATTSEQENPLLDDHCTADAATAFLNPSKTDHSNVMVSDVMVRHICDRLSCSLFVRVRGRLPYKIAKGASVVSWGCLWTHISRLRKRKQWVKHIEDLGLPGSATKLAGPTKPLAVVACLVLSSMMVPSHRIGS